MRLRLGIAAFAVAAFAGAIVVGPAVADLVVKDGGGTSRTIKNFVCETTKLCNATVLIKNDGTEIVYGDVVIEISDPPTRSSA